MKRLTAIEKGAVVFGFAFIIAGASMIIHPTDEVVFHPGSGYDKGARLPNRPLHVSKLGSRIYGGTAVVTGTGIICFAYYRKRE